MEIRKIGILTSGGDAPGMNAAIRAITRSALNRGIEVVGIYEGYKGLMEQNFVVLDHKAVSNIEKWGGTILYSARFPEFKNEEVRKQAAAILKENHIDALVCIGGDGTYMGAYNLSKIGVPCIGVPATIDNDIASTEYTIGFDTALNTTVSAVDNIRDTSASHNRVIAVEIMGNRHPDLTIRTGIACGAECVITSEADYSDSKILDAVHNAKKANKRHCIILIAEKSIDMNHIKEVLAKDNTYEVKTCILGHIQRGGSPNAFDRVLAARLGEYAIRLLNEGKTGVCVGVKGDDLIYTDIIKANELPRKDTSKLVEMFETSI